MQVLHLVKSLIGRCDQIRELEQPDSVHREMRAEDVIQPVSGMAKINAYSIR